MSENSSTTITGWPGFTGALFLVFLVLKLTEVIAWSWWWITAPLWGVAAVLIGGAVLFFLGACLVGVVRAIWGKK